MASPATLILADSDERRRLHELQAACDALTQKIADAELELETAKSDLIDFEQVYLRALRDVHQQLKAAERVVQALDRWAELLALHSRDVVPLRLDKALDKRAVQVEDAIASDDEFPAVGAPISAVPVPRDDRLKQAFRALARRYHPDLARTETERVQFGQWMARINDLYRGRDLEKLLSLAEQLKGGDVSDVEGEILDQIIELEKRQGWLNVVLGNLAMDRARVMQSSLAKLREECIDHEQAGEDPFAELRVQTMSRVESTMNEVKSALDRLEQTVVRYNRDGSEARGGQALTHFDPYADRRLVRLALQDLASLHASPAAKRWAEQLRERFAANPRQLRLALMAYASDLSAYPLSGLEKVEDARVRFDAVNADLEDQVSFEDALTSTSDILEWGVKHATSEVAYAGLRFLHDDLRTAMALLLRDIGFRRELKRVLYLLGEVRRCPTCETQVFALPLYRLRGLDDLRASVCPDCAHAFSSYWLARGGDVQSVLNDAFVDLEVIHEWSFSIGPGSIAMQVLPREEQSLTLGQLRKRLHDQVFARNDLDVPVTALELFQRGKKLSDRKLLEDLPERTVEVRFKPDAGTDVVTVLETLKHRIRTRFRK